MYLSLCSGGFSGDELLKLWKGLFYCLWMQDKPLLQVCFVCIAYRLLSGEGAACFTHQRTGSGHNPPLARYFVLFIRHTAETVRRSIV